MLTTQAVRQQLVLPQQRRLFDYWRGCCPEGGLPSRHDIDPACIKTHLPMISLTEIKSFGQGFRYQIRLAGTGFWDLYEDEIQGRYIDELPIGDRCGYWQRVLTQVVNRRRPSAGVTRPGTPLGSHLSQFWIRLPLSSNGRDVDMILGYDHLVKSSDLPATKPAQILPITA